jgi:predicted ArsR family transcriptional regulator
MSTREERLAAMAALAEPLRRRLYLHVAAQAEPVGRDDAAAALGISRSVAAFHLDKLADLGLLDVEYRRPPGRSGPGAGRPAKHYRAAERDVAFSVPERHYDVAASLLAQALVDAEERSVPASEALRAVARDYGRALGAELAEPGPAAPGTRRQRLVEVLSAHGYLPSLDAERVTLENCPFHRLAEEHRELVCGMNLEVITGLLEVAGETEARATLDPAPGRCCVAVAMG